jgi:RimJ/RimL family protein N-acetyltransferase
MRCDPAMMSDLGGPQPEDEVIRKAGRDAERAESGEDWILMIIPDGSEQVAGTVVVWTNTEHGEAFSEIGWMVLPEHQGRGLAKAAVAAVLQRAKEDARWGTIHAFPSISNGASNGICRSLGFTLEGVETIEFAGQDFTSNHWSIDPNSLGITERA